MRASPSAPRSARGTSLASLLAAAGLTLGLGWALPRLHPGLSWLAAVTVVTFVVFGLDKRAARRARRRTPERELLLLCLAGGSLGALAAMRLFRHKTVKGSFRLRYWSVVALQAAALAAWLVYARES